MDQYLREITMARYSDAAISILHFTISPHTQCIRAHWHDRVEILRVRDGEMHIEIGADTLSLHSGQIALIPPRMMHRGTSGDTTLDYDVLMFDVRTFYNDTALCKRLLPPLYDGDVTVQHITDLPTIIQRVDAICREIDQNSLEATAAVYGLIHDLYRHRVITLNEQRRKDITAQIIRYIEAHFSQDIRTATLCERFGYTAAHLCRKFKEATGLTPMNYLKIYRLEQAYERIKSGSGNISEIAAQCGYADANYFTRCFTAHFGYPPTHYR